MVIAKIKKNGVRKKYKKINRKPDLNISPKGKMMIREKRYPKKNWKVKYKCTGLSN